MKSKSAVILVILFVICLAFTGLTSCAPDSPSVPPDPGTGNQSGGNPQPQPGQSAGDEIVDIAVELKSAANDLDVLLLVPEINDDAWAAQVRLTLSDITTLCGQAYQAVPPDSITDDQAVFLETVDNIDDAVDLILKGIDEKNTGLIDQASAEMWLANEFLTRVVVALQ